MESEGWVETDDFDRQRAAQTRQSAAEREGDREYPLHVHPQPLRHPLVVDGRANLRAEPRALQAEDEERRHRQRHDDKEDAVGTEPKAGELH